VKIRKGFTLLEVILTLAILLIVISFPTRFFLFGSQVQKLSADETEIQASTRLISEHINYITRFATKTHSIPKSSFQYSEDGVRDPYTSYIGITKNGHVVIDKPGEEEDDPRIVEYVAKKQPGIDYEIIFDQEMYDKDGESSNGEEEKLDTVLSFSIVGKKDNKVVTEVISSVELLNSINIDHLGTDSDPAVALAFSMVEPGSQEWVEVSPDAYITMVLDISGSMNWDMDGKSESVTNPRIDILKSNANKMIDRLANMNFDIYVCLVPFSTSANNPGDFYNVNDEEDLNDLKNEVDVLTANGATNTGDGIRRAYHQLKNITDPLIEDGKSYSDFTQHMMVLVDGATNRESRERVGWFSRRRKCLFRLVC
jgi:prepilin-type N-terminal cleavage/methylation domain-containing protein